MFQEVKKQLTSIQILITLLIIAVGIYIFQNVWQVLSIFSDVFVLLISAWLLSFILEPIVQQFSKWFRINKITSATIVYILFLGLLGAIIFIYIPLVGSQLQSLLIVLPKYFASYPAFITHWGDAITGFLNNSLTYIPSVAGFLFNLVITLIISFYFIIDKEKINAEFLHLIPRKWHKDVTFVQEVIDGTFSSFLRVQLLFSIMVGLATWLVLRIFNIDYAASTALMSGILTMIPLVGMIFAMIPPILVSLLADPSRALFVTITLLVMQQIIYNILGPKILGRAFKLHPVIVLLSFIVGYKIAGGAGAIFAVPVLGIMVILLHRISRYFLQNKELSEK
jgi:predicted PurR-regulated permease PerM